MFFWFYFFIVRRTYSAQFLSYLFVLNFRVLFILPYTYSDSAYSSSLLLWLLYNTAVVFSISRNRTSVRYAHLDTVAAFMRLCFGQWCIPWPGRKKPTTITGVPTTTTIATSPSSENYYDDTVSISSAFDVVSAGEEPMTRALPSDASSAGRTRYNIRGNLQIRTILMKTF